MAKRLRIFPQHSAVTLRPRLACEITLEGVVAARQQGSIDTAAITSFAPLLAGSVVPALNAPNFPHPARIVAALRHALDQVVDRDRKLTLVIPDASVRVLLLDFDSLPDKTADVLPIIRFRLRKLLPFEVDDAAITYQVMTRDSNQVRALVAVTPHAVLAEYEAAVREAGYEPGAVLPSTLCAIAAIPDDTDALIVNQNAVCITTAITKQNEVLLHRTLDFHAASAEETGAEHGGDDTPDIQQAVSVAIAYFEDSLRTPLESLFYVGPGGAIAFGGKLSQPDWGSPQIQIRDLVEPPVPGVTSPVPTGLLAGVTGALAN
jgi:type IV pilus assembly protein PilM